MKSTKRCDQCDLPINCPQPQCQSEYNGQVHPKTTVAYEFPSAEGDRYYPVPRSDNAQLYARYRKLADGEFVGVRARQVAKGLIYDPATAEV